MNNPHAPGTPRIGERAIAFDLGGVMVDWDPRTLYRKLLGSEAEVERFLGEICTPEWNERQDAGRPAAVAVAELSARFPDEAELIGAYYERFGEMISGLIDDNVALARRLAARGVPLYALTNWSADTFGVLDDYPLLDVFAGVLVSGRVGLKKPDPAIYRRFLEEFDLEAGDVLFIDDREENVRGARSVGMAALRYRPGRDLGRDIDAWLGFL